MAAVVHALTSSETEAEEWRLRCDMAAVFRVAARLGWNEQIGNHNSLVLPQTARDEGPLFLINPRGMLFQELTASSLIVCDLDGRVVRGKGELRKVAFHIHARIHLKKPNATCIVHVHPQYLTALSMLEDPSLLLAHHNNLLLNDRTVYDTWATRAGGRQRRRRPAGGADGRQDHHGDGCARRHRGRRHGP
ncbi:MAG: class II aldolase/adducin family protein [Acetobacteraceae bacterium]